MDYIQFRQDDEDVLTADEVAKWLKVGKSWVFDHTTRYEPIIPHRRFGKKVRFIRGEVRKFLADNKQDKPTWEKAA